MNRRSMRGRSVVRKHASMGMAVAQTLEPRRLLATVLFEGFEGTFPTANGWSVGDAASAGTPAYWGGVDSAFGGESPYSGTRKGYCAGIGYAGTSSAPVYQNAMTAYMSRSINLAGFTNATLSFRYKIPSIEAGNYDHLFVSIDSTSLFDVSSPVTSWTQATYDLSLYVGSSHTLKFEFYSDANGTGEGAYLDDITVTGSPDTVTIGTGTGTWNYPFGSYYHDARTQAIYLASEIGSSGNISSLALDVTQIPGQTLNNFTIRMKQTSLSAYSSASWDGSGWTTVYQNSETISTTGWRTFAFATPFAYSNSSNLLVDFSFNNSSYSSDGLVRYSSTAGNRSLYYRTLSGYGDPLSWSGTSPLGTLVTRIPNVRLVIAAGPAAPTNVTATDGTFNDKVTITWTAAAGATGYEVWRNTTNSSATATKITSSGISGTSYDDTSAATGITYYYWVKAKNIEGTSGFSFSDYGYLMSPPSAPTGVTATDGTYLDRVRISWTTSSTATGYEVWRNSSNNVSTATKITDSDVTGTTYDDSAALIDTTYWYWVKARNAAGTSGFSTSNSGYVTTIPAPPTGVAASDGIYLDKVRVSWSGSAMASGYEVWRSTSDDSSTAIQITSSDVTGTTYDDTTALVEMTYWYWVKAKNVLGTSGFSSSNSGYLMTIPAAPTGVAASDGTYADRVRLSWSASAMAAGYEVWRNTSDDSSTATKITSTDVTGTSYDDLSGAVATTHYYWVKAKNAAGTSDFSLSNSGFVLPPAPTGVTASDGVYADKVRVSWSASVAATGYQVWRNTTNSSSSAALIANDVGGTTYDDLTASVGTTYYYWVKAITAVGTSGFSSSDYGTRMVPPLAPTGVTASDATYVGKVRISWTASTNTTGYEVWCNTSNDSSTATKLTPSDIAATSYDDTSAVAGITYFYWVKAKNDAGASSFSASNSGFWRAAVPTGVSATDGMYVDKVQVSWTASLGASGYEIWRNTTNSSATATIIAGDVTGTVYDDSSAVAGVTYYYWVKAKDAAGTSFFSASNSGYALTTPSAPVTVTASDGAYVDRVRVSWSSSAMATGYELWRNASDDSSTSTKLNSSDITATSYDDTSAVAGITYFYWVKAKNSEGTSDFSTSNSGYWRAAVPTGISATDGTYTDKVQVSWTASLGATEYEVWRNTTNSSATATITAGGVTGTTYDDSSAVAGTTYYYWVKARDAAGTSGFSGSDSGYRLGIPSVPSGVGASDGTYGDRVRVSWTASSYAAGYEVWRSTKSDSSTATKVSGSDVAGTSYDDSSAVWDTTYYYWVKAKNAAGTSDFSVPDSGYSENVLYVDDSAVGKGDGLSWANAFTSLQTALSQAAPGGEIRVAAGTYRPTQTTDRNISFQLRNGISIVGGYAGNDADPGLRDTNLYQSVLSGDIGQTGYRSDNSYHVVAGTNLDSTAIMDGFTITGGNATLGLGYSGFGAGLCLESSSPTFRDVRFLANAAEAQGGAVYADYQSSPSFVNSLFVGNTANYGGAVDAYNAVLTNCTIVGNSAIFFCGGIYNAIAINSIIWGNTASRSSQPASGSRITYSDVQQPEGAFPGTGNVNLDPQFVRLPSPGADGMWGSSDDDYGDLRLRPFSPLVDAGNGAALVGISTDLAGKPRFADVPTTPDTGVAPVVDIGAYEAVPALDALIAGPYRFAQSPAVTLTGLGSSSVPGALSFAWDLDNDGQYDDATGANPVASFTGYSGPVTLTVRLRVTDAAGQNTTASANFTVVPAVLYVDDSAVGAGTGLSWANAFTSLQSALALAAPGTEIRVAGGTYKPTTTTNRSISFDLQSGVRVLGGYAGYGAAEANARNIAQYISVLSGDIGAANDRSDNSYHVVRGINLDLTAVLDGFTITAGNANGPESSTNRGGGLNLWAARPTIANTRFVANSALYGGGAYVTASLSPKMVNCTFVGNIATYTGGGLVADYSTLTLTNSSIVGNFAGGDSGGLISYDGYHQMTLENSIVWLNTAPRYSQFAFNSAVIRATYSAVQGGYTGTGNTGADPQFVRNPSPGADGLWGTSDDDYGDLRLRALSPLADMGNNAAAGLVGVSTDIANNPRFVDIPTGVDGGNGAAPMVDIGAYEAQPALDAQIAGPYRIRQGPDLTLTGLGSSDVPGSLTFAWDFDDDGLYDDATGASPLFSTTGYAALTTLPIRLRVTDASGNSAEASSIFTIVPTVLYVDDSAAGAGTGLSWADAYTSLQSALAQVVPGCEIRVAGGVYKPTTTTDRTISFQLTSGIAIRGGYAGYGASNPDARDILVYRTVLSGDIGAVGTRTDNSMHVVVARDLTSTAVLDGLIIAAGYASGSGDAGLGGGLYLPSGQVKVANCIFVGNYAQNGGAINATSDSSPLIVNSLFLGNSATNGGVMRYESFPSPVLANSIFFANTASSVGGVLCGFGAILANSILWSNTAPSDSQISGTATVTYSDVQGGWTGTGNINADPLFIRNPAPGPDGVWGTDDDDLGDLRLQAGSPAISAGSNAAIPAGITTDFAGAPRIINGVVDMGVYERDQAPTDLVLTGATVVENQSVGWPIGTFMTNDPDTGDTFTYSLASGEGSTNNASFAIVGNELRTGATFDYETKSSYSIRVRATDQDGLYVERTFTISITDVNEAPNDVALSAPSIPESQPVGTTIGTFSTADLDAGDTFTYLLVSGEGDADNASFSISGDQLLLAASLDFETQSSYLVRVRSTDQGGLWCEKTFTISVTDVDEIAPTVASVSINDGAAQRSMVKKLSVVFSEPVVFATDALQVKLKDGTPPANTTVSVTNPSGDQQSYVLTFSGSAVVGGSLADGIYDLIVSATGVQDLAGNPLTANFSRRFHRLFGDSDGNRIVNALDYARLKNSFARSSSDPLFNSAFDYEGNNLINALDLARFRQRYGLSFSY